MYGHRASRIVVVLCLIAVLVSSIQAADLDDGIQRRQNAVVGTGVSPSGTSTASSTDSVTPSSTVPTSSSQDTGTSTPTSQSSSTADTSSTSETSSAETSTSNSATSLSTPTTTSSTVAASTTSTTPSSPQTQPSSSDSEAPSQSHALSSTSYSPSTTSAKPHSTSAAVSSATQRIVTTIVTVSGSSTISQVITTNALVAVTPTGTSDPTLAEGDGGSTQNGLSSQQKNIIIGVIVGVGGAALLGGLAVVAWRIWGRKKRQAEENDELMAGSPESPSKEDRNKDSGNSSLRPTTDQYRNPSVPFNAAANF